MSPARLAAHRAAHSAVILWRTLAIGSVVLWALVLFSDRLDNWLSPRPLPYTDVEVQSVTMEPLRGVRIVATYIKTDERCAILNMVAYGLDAEARVPLNYTAYRGPNEHRDRTPGLQTMNVVVDENGVDYDRIELVTQHDCEGYGLVAMQMLEVRVPK